MSKNNEKLNIELTREQYLTLLKAVYLGEWVANANRVGHGEDSRLAKYEEIKDYLFSLAPQFGFSKNIEHELEYNESGTTEVSRLHEEYDAETFWDELCDRLGTRDFYRKYTKEEAQKMTDEEHFLKLQECIIQVEEEIEEHGLERLVVMKAVKDFGI